MTPVLPAILLGSLSLLCVPMSAWAQDVARPDLVREVAEGKRHVARVSWWGFDPQDSTQFLQTAIDSRVKRLIVDRQASAWNTRPLTGVSHQEIVFEEGTGLVAVEGAFRGQGDCLLTFEECEHVILRGWRKGCGPSTVLRMRKEDYQSGAYQKSEWRHGVSVRGCRDILIRDLTIERTGGDGIYLGATPRRNVNVNVVIQRVDCTANHRQGISVISAENLLIEECRLRNTDGTDPRSGIDFEPNDPTQSLVNCTVRLCHAENNAGSGYAVCPQYLNSGSRPLSLRFEGCVSRGNRQHGIHLCSAQQDPPRGVLRLDRFVSENDGMAGLSVQFNPFDGIRIEVRSSVLRDCARKDAFFPPIYVQGLDREGRPAGNLHFKHVDVYDDVERPFFRIRDRKGNGVKDITGQIRLRRGGRTERITLNPAWLEKTRRAESGSP